MYGFCRVQEHMHIVEISFQNKSLIKIIERELMTIIRYKVKNSLTQAQALSNNKLIFIKSAMF